MWDYFKLTQIILTKLLIGRMGTKRLTKLRYFSPIQIGQQIVNSHWNQLICQTLLSW
jgi:hypothetical protein